MCANLTNQVRSIAKVTTAVARGDLTQKIDIEVEGEMLTLKRTVNSMVDQLSAFASEVTRVALEVGTQGILGGQARVDRRLRGRANDGLLLGRQRQARRTARAAVLTDHVHRQLDRLDELGLGVPAQQRVHEAVERKRGVEVHLHAGVVERARCGGEGVVGA